MCNECNYVCVSLSHIEQMQNPVHIRAVGDDKFEAFIKASETFSVCCGRNIAFISESPSVGNDGSISTYKQWQM